MSKANCRSKVFGLLALAWFAAAPAVGASPEAAGHEKRDGGFYKDVFDQVTYYESVNALHLDRLYRRVFSKKAGALNINRYDEVPDSTFFTNRHGREKLSAAELERGYAEDGGPDLSGPLTVTGGKFEGARPTFIVRDAKGGEYRLKFDPVDNFELVTSAEVIASRFYHALGYFVPQTTIAVFDPFLLEIGEGARMWDDTGFRKKLTPERLQEALFFLPLDAEGNLRASATKTLAGEDLGPFTFHGRRKSDPDDPVRHRRRREIRALSVFASWLNNYDKRESNTADRLIDGKIRHYLMDFDHALGSASDGPQPPMFGHEHLFDYGEMGKAILTLGWREKPWQKRWREAGEKVSGSPAVGYFDNRRFSPADFKTQLPYYAFKDVTRADGFWAAKILMSFSDDDIRALVRAGQFSAAADADSLVKILAERRDLIGRYWFSQATPLDRFDVRGGQLRFEDLAVRYGFARSGETEYRAAVLRPSGEKMEKISEVVSREPSFALEPAWTEAGPVVLEIRSVDALGDARPYVRVTLEAGKVRSVRHQD
ncbi:MAG: hypothetical protein ACOY3K_03325 [Candidatus Omnitrophota bacterium]